MDIRAPAEFNIKEKDIENFLKSRLSEIVSEEHLMLIGQERSFQEEADLLALDKDAVLYIFELKRWESNKENLLQVLRYGQIFGQYKYKELEKLAHNQQKMKGSLKKAHKIHFDLNEPIKKSKFNRKQHFVLVTNGIDSGTISAVDYWSELGVKISCSPYRIYEIGGNPYVQFDTFNPDGDINLESNTQYFIVNTNKTYMADGWKHMFDKSRAAAWGNRRWDIMKIKSNDLVYLYHTGVGVIAKGKAISNYQDKDEEFFVPLKFDWTVEPERWSIHAVKPWEINSKLGSGYKFRQTVFSISEHMVNAIDDIKSSKK